MLVYFDYSKIVKKQDGKFKAYEVGCGCCSGTVEMSKEDVLNEIKSLKKKIKELERMIE